MRGVTGLWAAMLVAGLVCPEHAFAQNAPGSYPSYEYGDTHLRVRLPEGSAEVARVKIQGLDTSGRRRGKRATRTLPVIGPRRVEIPIGADPAHRVEIRVGKTVFRMLTTRGTWYSIPRPPETSGKLVPRDDTSSIAIALTDIALANAFSTTHGGSLGDSHLEIGRTFGPEDGKGVRLPREGAIVIVSRGSIGSAIVTLTERSGRRTYRYHDYPLAIGKDWSRLVIPIERFTARIRGSRPPRTMVALSLRSHHPSRASDVLEIAHVGMLERAPRIERITRLRRRAEVRTSQRLKGLEVFMAPVGQQAFEKAKAQRRGRRYRIRNPPEGAVRLYACINDRKGGRACDPPDAPASSYLLAPKTGEYLIDAFFHGQLLNAHRAPTAVFTSTAGQNLEPFYERNKQGLTLRQPKSSSLLEYVGYSSPIPAMLPRGYDRLRLRLAGGVHLSDVRVGLRTTRGHERKVVIGQIETEPLGATSRDVDIPLSRLVVRKASRRNLVVNITVSSTDTPSLLRIERISLVPAP